MPKRGAHYILFGAHAPKSHRPSACSKLYGVPASVFLFEIRWCWIGDNSEAGGGGGESGEAWSGRGDRKSGGGGGVGEERERGWRHDMKNKSGWWT